MNIGTKLHDEGIGRTSRKLVLVVDDDTDARRSICEGLQGHGYHTLEAADGDSMRAFLADYQVSLVILGLNLKSVNGLGLAGELRTVHDLPFVIISTHADPVDIIVGLEIGADDYVSKPFNLRELIARVNTVMRRSERASTAGQSTIANAGTRELYSFSRFELDSARRQLKDRKGILIELTTAEYNLLHLFVLRPNRVLTRNEIMDRLKGHDWSPTDRSIDVLVAKIRKKMGDEDENSQIIRTIRGAGYMLATEVHRR